MAHIWRPLLTSSYLIPTTYSNGLTFRTLCYRKPSNARSSDTDPGNRSRPQQFENQMDPISNIRPLNLDKVPHESALEKKYREACNETWKWLDEYWGSHNLKFMQAKRNFLEKHTAQSGSESPDCRPDLTTFHRQFLHENQSAQMRFNFEWYRRIGYIVFLNILVDLQHIFEKLASFRRGTKLK